jgi:hypothetical protein
MPEGLINIYYKKLIIENDSNPGKVIAKFFWELFEITPRTQDIIMFNKLVKLFGREIVFETVIDSFNISNVDFTKSLYPLYLAIAKRKIETKDANTQYIDLSEYFKLVKEKIESIKKSNGK